MVISRDGATFNYSGAHNSRSPYVPLGVNRCGGNAHAPSVKGGWCSPTSGVEAHTSFDTSAMYMASGYLNSTLGDEVYFYASGQAPTHGGDAGSKLWANQTGIRVLRARKDGLVSVTAPYLMNVAPPTLTTVKLTVPTSCPPPVVHTVNSTSKTGCGYEFPGNVCPANEPGVQCKTTANCLAHDRKLSCHGIPVTCKQGICQSSGTGSQLCSSKAGSTTNITSQVGADAFSGDHSASAVPHINRRCIVANVRRGRHRKF